MDCSKVKAVRLSLSKPGCLRGESAFRKEAAFDKLRLTLDKLRLTLDRLRLTFDKLKMTKATVQKLNSE